MSNSDDLLKLATEACEQWQQQLTSFTSDPKAKAELMRLMEPSRQMMVEWTKRIAEVGKTDNPSTEASPAVPETPATAAPMQSQIDDNALRLAQLACRVADLEQRIYRLELELSNTSSSDTKPKRAMRS